MLIQTIQESSVDMSFPGEQNGVLLLHLHLYKIVSVGFGFVLITIIC